MEQPRSDSVTKRRMRKTRMMKRTTMGRKTSKESYQPRLGASTCCSNWTRPSALSGGGIHTGLCHNAFAMPVIEVPRPVSRLWTVSKIVCKRSVCGCSDRGQFTHCSPRFAATHLEGHVTQRYSFRSAPATISVLKDKFESNGHRSPENSQLRNIASTAEHACGNTCQQRPHKNGEPKQSRCAKSHLCSQKDG